MSRVAVAASGALTLAAFVALALDGRAAWSRWPLGAVVPPGGMSSTAAYEFAQESRTAHAFVGESDEEAQPATLPPLPRGMTVEMIALGDAIYHGTGGCAACHGAEATGLSRRGKSLTVGLIYMPASGLAGWAGLDSLILNGMAETVTRSPIAMPARGLRSDLTADETRLVAAYVWAIAHVRGEPWPGGHVRHATGPGTIAPRTTGP